MTPCKTEENISIACSGFSKQKHQKIWKFSCHLMFKEIKALNVSALTIGHRQSNPPTSPLSQTPADFLFSVPHTLQSTSLEEKPGRSLGPSLTLPDPGMLVREMVTSRVILALHQGLLPRVFFCWRGLYRIRQDGWGCNIPPKVIWSSPCSGKAT